MKRFGLFCFLCGVAGAVCGGENFAAQFDAYAPQEALSSKGAEGGTWRLVSGTCIAEPGGSRSAMVLDGRADFMAASIPAENFEQIDVSFRVEELERGTPEPAEGLGGFSAGLLRDTAGYYGWGDGHWNFLTVAEVPPTIGAWIEARLETKTIAGSRFVSYLVKNPNGEYVRAIDKAGRAWFQAGASTTKRGVSFSGIGAFSNLAGTSEMRVEGPIFCWCGGAAGDWNDPANWTSNGVAAAGVPGLGSTAFVTGPVTLTNGTEQARVNFIAVADGRSLMAADFETTIELKANRPRVGTEITLECGTLFGSTPVYDCMWEKSNYLKSFFTPVSRADSLTPQMRDYGNWFRFTAARGGVTKYTRMFYFSKLPVCYLTTDDGKTPSASKEVHTGTLFVQGNDEFKHQYDGAMTINVRGNSSRNYAKKPYKIKLAEKTKMFGIPKKNKHWVLLANYNDLSQTRNKLPYDFANEVGNLGMESTWVDCILNGKLLGTYQFCEHIRVDEGRVEIYDWEEHAAEYGATDTNFKNIDTLLAADVGSVDITGGYLFEFSTEADEVTKFDIAAGSLTMHTMAARPEYLKTSTKMLDWSKRYLQNYFNAITAWDGCTSDGRHWSELCDLDSMVTFFLVNELFDNGDMGQKSRYAYIDRGGKLVWGPVWDYDWGSYSRTVDNRCEKWRSAGGGEANMNREWTTDPLFCLRAYETYWKIRDRYAAIYAEGGTFDQAIAHVRESARIDEKIWSPRKDTANVTRTFEGDVAILRDFHAKRLAWMDRQFVDVATLMKSLRNTSQTHPYSPDSFEVGPAVKAGSCVYEIAFRRARRVKAILNGHVLGKFKIVNGTISGELPKELLVTERDRRNCLALVAYDPQGEVLARNYVLFSTVSNGFVLKIR